MRESALNHLGVEVPSSADVVAATRRFPDAGLAHSTAEVDACCHAVQDKAWVEAPDVPLGAWEFYTVLDDNPGGDQAPAGTCCAPSADELTACCAGSAAGASDMASQTGVLDAVGTIGDRIHRSEPAGPDPDAVEVTLLGGFAVRVDGRAIPPGRWSRRHSAALVKLLALTPAAACTVNGSSTPCGRTSTSTPPRRDCTRQRTTPAGPRSTRRCRTQRRHRPSLSQRRGGCRAWHGSSGRPGRRSRNGGTAEAKGALALYRGELLPHDLSKAGRQQRRP